MSISAAPGPQPGQNAGRRVERGSLDFGGAGKGREYDLGVARCPRRVLRRLRAARAQTGRRLGADIADRQPVAGVDQTPGHRRAHRPGADKAELHLAPPVRLKLPDRCRFGSMYLRTED
jgi:hypothetical protein